MKIFFSPSALYQNPGHPENPQRISSTLKYLHSKGLNTTIPEKMGEHILLKAHSQKHIDKVKNNSFHDLDTPNIPGIFNIALESASAAVQAARECKKEFCFSLMRPPGHHAGKNFLGGFCYFNNLALSVLPGKTCIIDFDAHHGNGTEDIFIGNNQVWYFSIHQYPAFPGTGTKSIDNMVNIPVSPKTPAEDYMSMFKTIIEKVSSLSPNFIAVSAGFDAHKDDPLTDLMLTEEHFQEIGKMIASLNKPTFAVLEGGYNEKLPASLYNFLTPFQHL